MTSVTVIAVTLLLVAVPGTRSRPESEVPMATPESASTAPTAHMTTMPTGQRTAVDGVQVHRSEFSSPPVDLTAAWVTLPQEDSLNAAVEQVVNTWTDELRTSATRLVTVPRPSRAEAVPVRTDPTRSDPAPSDPAQSDPARRTDPATSAPHVAIDWDIPTATGTIIAIRLAAAVRTGGTPVEFRSSTVYGDVADHTTWGSAELFADPAPVATAVAGALHTAGVLDRSASERVAAEPGLLDDVTIQADGSLLVVTDSALTGARAPRVVLVPAEIALPTLSGRGAVVAAAVAAPTPFTVPQPPPVVTGVDCAAVPCVALTFDDGPVPDTMRLLDILDLLGVKATFFVVGTNVQRHPEIVAAAAARGHEIGAHSWSHRKLTTLTPEEVAADAQATAAAIQAATGSPPPFVRPPYGAYDDMVRTQAGAPLVLWNVDTEDWKSKDTVSTTQRAVTDIKPGSIILMHDIWPSTVDAVADIVAQLRAVGLQPVTVGELLAGVDVQSSVRGSRP